MSDTSLYLDPGYSTRIDRTSGHQLSVDPSTKRWVSSQEMAEIFGISVYSVRRAVRAGRLVTAEVLPGLVRIDIESVPGCPAGSRRAS